MTDSRRRHACTALLFLLAANTSFLPYPPFDAHALAWFWLAPMFALLDRVGTRLRNQLVAVSLYAGWFFCVGHAWVATTMQEFAGTPVIASYLLLVLFAMLGASAFVPFVILRRVWLPTGGSSGPGAILGVAGLWLGMELWFPRLFPWYAGLTQHDVELTRQLASLAGITAISLPLVLSNLTLYELFRAWRAGALPRWLRVEASVASAIVVCALGYCVARVHSEPKAGHPGEKIRVALIQGNIDNVDKTANQGGRGAAAEDVIHRYERLTLEAARSRPDLFVWPETAFPRYVNPAPFADSSSAGWDAATKRRASSWRRSYAWLERLAAKAGAPIIVGAIEATGKPGEHGGERNYNGALVVAPGRPMQSYRKIALIPFGEAVPRPLDVLFPWIEGLLPWSIGLSRGESMAPLDVVGYRIATSICYEATLDGFIREMVNEGGARILVNLANDSWFGRTGEPAQHLAATSFRATELRVPLLRVTNSGITAYIDHTGRVHDPSECFVEAIRIYDVVVPVDAGETLFARWDSLPMELLCGLALLATLGRWLKR